MADVVTVEQRLADVATRDPIALAALHEYVYGRMSLEHAMVTAVEMMADRHGRVMAAFKLAAQAQPVVIKGCVERGS